MRRAILRAVELVRRGVDKLVLELPTGYGKTEAAPVIYKAFRERGVCWKAIHVFPLRTLLHKTLEKYSKKYGDISFTYQDGDISLVKSGYVKDPYFTGEYVLTTIDSFVHNLFKAPVAELPRLLRGRSVHYHVPFAYIYPACVFFDEAHIMAEGGQKAAAALRVTVEALVDAEIPVMVMSATLGEWKWEVFKGFEFVTLGPRGTAGHDPDFEAELEETRYVTKVIREEDVLAVAREEVKSGRRVLIVVNNISKVVKWYQELRDYGAVLIHSLLTREDRRKAEESLCPVPEKCEAQGARIVVGTSAIEAGVDVSFDTLITSADSPESVAQRVGRVCRRGGKCEGRIYVFGKDAERYLGVREWRLPYKEGSYVPLLSKNLESDRRLEWFLRQLYRMLYVDPGSLSNAFKDFGYTYVREYGLLEVCTSVEYSPEKCFSTSIDRVNFPVGVVVDGKVQEVEKVDERWLMEWVEDHGEFPILYAKKYVPGVGPL